MESTNWGGEGLKNHNFIGLCLSRTLHAYLWTLRQVFKSLTWWDNYPCRFKYWVGFIIHQKSASGYDQKKVWNYSEFCRIILPQNITYYIAHCPGWLNYIYTYIYIHTHKHTYMCVYVYIYIYIWLLWILVVASGILFPNQGLNPGPLHWRHRVLATGPAGKSLDDI